MVASGVPAVNDAFDVTIFEVSEFMPCKVTEMHTFLDVTTKMYFLQLFYLMHVSCK